MQLLILRLLLLAGTNFSVLLVCSIWQILDLAFVLISDRGSHKSIICTRCVHHMEAWRYKDATPEILKVLKLPSDDELEYS